MSWTGRPCSVCAHPDRLDIEHQIVAGATLASLSGAFGMSLQSLARHRHNHLPGAAMAQGAAERAAQEAEHGEDLVQSALGLRQKAVELLHQAEKARDLQTALMGVREAGRLLEIQAKLTGRIDTSTTVNVTVSQQFLSVQAVILSALAPFPEARLAVVQALAQVEEAA